LQRLSEHSRALGAVVKLGILRPRKFCNRPGFMWHCVDDGTGDLQNALNKINENGQNPVLYR